jgi:Protein of unknown function (DUF2384)
MATSELIDRVADDADVEPEEVERIIALTAARIEAAAEAQLEVQLPFGSGKSDVVLALLTALARAEQEGTVDEPTLSTLRAVRNLVVHGGNVERLIGALMPDDIAVPTPAVVLQARRNAEARNALLQEFGALRSHEVADLAGSHASNRAALANRWRAEKRLVAVPVADELLYPGFQLTPEGRPHPAIKEALDWLLSAPYTSDWQAALWFVTPTGWLGGRRPVDLLDEEPEAVAEAARREVSDVAG